MKLGLVVFANDSGLGAQTRRLCYMLRPDQLLAIDSSPFSKNVAQHWDWYDAFTGYRVHGFPKNNEIKFFLRGLTHVLVCENPLNVYLLSEAKRLGIKVFIQSNYEFCDHLDKQLVLPYKFLMPSHWMIDAMKAKFGDDMVEYCPPPIDPNEFTIARETNLARTAPKRLLHIVGTLAAHDRNGTLDLLKALPFITGEFSLVIRSQHQLPDEYHYTDPRVTYQFGNVPTAEDMYRDFDALVLPRRYGGLSLTCNEALMSALPVIMPDISPNNQLLPSEWLVPATKRSEFFTRTMIDVYGVNPRALARKIDQLLESDLQAQKVKAFNLGYTEFASSVIKQKYDAILGA